MISFYDRIMDLQIMKTADLLLLCAASCIRKYIPYVDNVMKTEKMNPPTTNQYLFILFTVLSGMGVTLCVLVGAFYIRYRHLRLVKMSSPRVNLISISGAALIFIACGCHNITFYILNFPNAAVSTYKVSISLGSCGFTIFYGSILLKTWRVFRIFEGTGSKRPVIRDKHLITGVVLLLLTDVILLLVWQSVDDIKVVHQVNSLSNATVQAPAKIITRLFPFTCSHLVMWLTILFLWKAFLVCFGSYLSWAVRLVTVPALGDGPVLMLCSYVALLSTAVAVVLLALNAFSANSYVTVIQTWLIAGTTVSLLVSHAAKIFNLLSSVDLTKMAFARNASQNASYECIEEELYALTVENNQLKKELIQREDLIRELQSRINLKYDSGSDEENGSKVTRLPTETNCINESREVIEKPVEDVIVGLSAGLQEMTSDSRKTSTVQEESEVSLPHLLDVDTDDAGEGGSSLTGEERLAPKAVEETMPNDDEEVVVEEMEFSPNDSPSREQDPLVVRYPTVTKVVTTTKRTVPKDGNRRAVTVTRKTTTTTTTTRCRRGSILRSASRRQAQAAVSRSRVLRYELAQTIAESYNLSKDGDTISYVSHCLSPSLMDEALRKARDHEGTILERPQCLSPLNQDGIGELKIEDLGLEEEDEEEEEDGLVIVNDRLQSPCSAAERLSVTPVDPLSEQASPRLNSGGKSWKKRFSQRFLADSFLSPTVNKAHAGSHSGPLPFGNCESPEDNSRDMV